MSKLLFLVLGITVGVVVLGFAFQWSVVTQGWPFLLFLLCPLMHIFMGHDHGGSGHGERRQHPSSMNKKDGGSCH